MLTVEEEKVMGRATKCCPSLFDFDCYIPENTYIYIYIYIYIRKKVFEGEISG